MHWAKGGLTRSVHHTWNLATHLEDKKREYSRRLVGKGREEHNGKLQLTGGRVCGVFWLQYYESSKVWRAPARQLKMAVPGTRRTPHLQPSAAAC